MDPFETLGLPRRFDVDSSELEQHYRDLQRALHPDKFTQASSSERRMRLEQAMRVNEAYRVLRDPIARAEALLRFGASGPDEKSKAADPGFLMWMMEARELLAAARARNDLGAVKTFDADVAARERACEAKLRVLLDGLDSSTHTQATALVSELKYYRRFRDEVRDFEHETLDAAALGS